MNRPRSWNFLDFAKYCGTIGTWYEKLVTTDDLKPWIDDRDDSLFEKWLRGHLRSDVKSEWSSIGHYRRSLLSYRVEPVTKSLTCITAKSRLDRFLNAFMRNLKTEKCTRMRYSKYNIYAQSVINVRPFYQSFICCRKFISEKMLLWRRIFPSTGRRDNWTR